MVSRIEATTEKYVALLHDILLLTQLNLFIIISVTFFNASLMERTEQLKNKKSPMNLNDQNSLKII